ncbi:peptidoglycan-binding domain-containing protein [Streptacidiphilus cavernicola]|uniref:Peptidoglycan-binding domain-containing protein n=1 Tax=Streptacidiphilus cavernicola TaxID=3342716 RepID=A0ABV6VRE1_9ACTN
MAGQLCGRCGGSLGRGGCGCPPRGESRTPGPGRESGPGYGPGFGTGHDAQDEPTAIIPILDAPELVRPYITPTEVIDAEVLEDDADPAYGPYGGSVVPGIDAPHTVRSSRARVLAGQLVGTPGEAAEGPGAPGRRGVSRRAAAAGTAAVSAAASTELVPRDPGTVAAVQGLPGHRGPRRGRARRAAVIAAGALTVAGLGTAAALAPSLLSGGGTDRAQPQPGMTLALPTAGPDTATGTSKAPAAVRPSASAPASQAATPARSATGRPSGSASSAPSSQAPHGNAPNNPPSPTATSGQPSPTVGPNAASQTLQLGDTGTAVATLQGELSQLWIDRDLPANGTFDARTQQDVAAFQVWYGVRGDPTGVFGPNSRARMNQLFHHH